MHPRLAALKALITSSGEVLLFNLLEASIYVFYMTSIWI